jgi:alkylation response protein AidB-like acyl-CoA dehydrogenase
MDVLLNADEQLLQNNARAFFERECPVSVARDMEADPLGYAPDLWRKMAELGWLSFALPPAYGGDGAPLTQLGLLVEEIGRAVAPVPFLSTLAPALTIAEAGTAAQCQDLLPRIGRGDLLVTWALSEHDPRLTPETIHTAAVRAGDAFLITGTKLFVENMPSADKVLVVCRTAPAAAQHHGITLFLVDRPTPGLAQTLVPTLAGDKQSTVELQQVRVPSRQVVGEVHQGWPLVERMLERTTALICAQIVGATRKAVEMAVEYAKWRVAFGRPIGAFQAIQHMCADMVTWVDGAQLLTYEALWTLDQGLPAGLAVATAKAFTNDRCQAALRHANQIHGGVAQIKEFDLNLWYRRAAAWAMRFGTSFEQRRRIAQALALT